MQPIERLYPQGKIKAFTLSYDDGVTFDRRFIKMLNAHNLKATFHLNSGVFGTGEHINEDEVSDLYRGHEISLHSLTHPFFNILSDTEITAQIFNDRMNLERLSGYPVTGFSYPFGAYDLRVADIIAAVGVSYARTVEATRQFDLPKDFLVWHPTCHHNELDEHIDRFIAAKPYGMSLLYCWGHSYEFDRENTWDYMEACLKKIAGREEIWYATNIEIYRYITAAKNLIVSANSDIIYNPSAISVWVRAGGEVLEVGGGEMVRV